MFYEAPEAKIICFAPVENIANNWDWSIEDDNGIGGGTGSEFDIPFIGDEGDPNN